MPMRRFLEKLARVPGVADNEPEEGVEREGLRKECQRLELGEALRSASRGRDDDRGYLDTLTVERAKQLPAASVGKVDIEQEEVWPHRCDRTKRVPDRGLRPHLQPSADEIATDDVAERRVVFYDQDVTVVPSTRHRIPLKKRTDIGSPGWIRRLSPCSAARRRARRANATT